MDTSLTRRRFLKYVGASAVATWAAGCTTVRVKSAVSGSPFQQNWRDVEYPVPLPGEIRAVPPKFAVQDDLVLPHGFSYRVLAAWGDRFGPSDDPKRQIRFGYNADYTGLVPRRGYPDEFWLIVNHEYVSARPWLQSVQEVLDLELPQVNLHPDPEDSESSGFLEVEGLRFAGPSFDSDEVARAGEQGQRAAMGLKRLCDAILDDMGISVLHLKRRLSGRLEVLSDSIHHKRVTGVRSINASRGVTLSGPLSERYPRAVGTIENCSGATTPWGTFLSCEENYQDIVPEFVDASGDPLAERGVFNGKNPHPQLGLPVLFRGVGHGSSTEINPLTVGWVSEVDPESGGIVKHTAMGRFRHENVALRVTPGAPLEAYMGDDRRGGHVWKFRSRGDVVTPNDRKNSDLLSEGTLYVARFNEDFTGRWIPLLPNTPLAAPEPERMSTGHLLMPRRPEGGPVAVGVSGAEHGEVSGSEWIESVEKFADKAFSTMTLADLLKIKPGETQREQFMQAVLCRDAFLMGNAVGGTPSARPEDIEVHPEDGSVYIAFTDSTGKDEGAPDIRAFPDSQGENSRQYGAIYRIVEVPDDPLSFHWGRFVSSGEAIEGGGGFACADNLFFDSAANLWMVCDISEYALNISVDRKGDTRPGSKRFRGIFGNNSMFMIPTQGLEAGLPRPFAIGPMECEMTGPTFLPNEEGLILSIQHPGESNGVRGYPGSSLATEDRRSFKIAGSDRQIYDQERVVPLGSNFAARSGERSPRPAVVVIEPV